MNFSEGPHFWPGGPPTYWPVTTQTHHSYHLSHSAAHYNQNHLENCKIGLENSGIFLPKEWEPWCDGVCLDEESGEYDEDGVVYDDDDGNESDEEYEDDEDEEQDEEDDAESVGDIVEGTIRCLIFIICCQANVAVSLIYHTAP